MQKKVNSNGTHENILWLFAPDWILQPIKQAVTMKIKRNIRVSNYIMPYSYFKTFHFKISSVKEKGRNAIVSAYVDSFQKYFK